MDNLEKGIKYLEKYNNVKVYPNLQGFNAFRALMNITMPDKLDDNFFDIQDKIIQAEYKNKEIINVDDLSPIKDNICLYQKDITLLKADAIVNACNSELLGCFQPLHKCIDNAIHSYAGLQVRKDLLEIMQKQDYKEPNGKAKITKGYNLPAKYIIHTVGPIVNGNVTKQNEIDLYNCYQSALKLASEYNLKNIVFCSISTGVYGYPIEKASIIALKSIKDYFSNNENTSIKKVVIDVFSRSDYDEYQRAISKIN